MSDDPILSALVRLEAGQASLSTDFQTLRTDFQALQTDFQPLRTDSQTLRTDFQALRTDFLAELGQTRGAIMEKVAELQSSVTAIRDDIAVNMGGVDAARQANDNTRADVTQMREQMSVMWKQIKTLEARVRGITGEP
jgi:chromosome segregation ATPase